jgi:hypothetical protein
MLLHMDIQTIWIIALAVSTPIAGVVGFALQLRLLEKSRSENLKLQLEIEELRRRATKAESRIYIPTHKEVVKSTRPDLTVFRTDVEPDMAKGPVSRKVRRSKKLGLKPTRLNLIP